MRKIICALFFISGTLFSQVKKDSLVKKTIRTKIAYKKRVLEATEIDLLSSFYTQDGNNAAVTGGIGTEQLNDIAGNINISIPLNDDDVLNIDATISAYSSASSSNLNPFYNPNNKDDDEYGSSRKNKIIRAISGASTSSTTDDENKETPLTTSSETSTTIRGTPWVASSGASKKDVWVSGVVGYGHSSDDRNSIYKVHISFANEFDYSSFGGGIGFTKLFNQKNTEMGINANVYIDNWKPVYPSEIKTFKAHKGNLNTSFFNGVDIYNQQGVAINKNSLSAWKPINTNLVDTNARNSYSVSLNFSQILSKNSQIAIFADFLLQQGWLANPMQRVYFSDKPNFYIGEKKYISNYTNSKNKGVFQLADDIERLPRTRTKIPIGVRYHYYINEKLTLRTYYRYYFDNWGITSQTFNVEFPIKLGEKYTMYPSFRFYNQTQSDYFAPYEQHLSTEVFYTSDYDLSKYSANQYGIGLRYTDIFTSFFGLKNINFNYHFYKRNTGLTAHIISFGVKFVLE